MSFVPASAPELLVVGVRNDTFDYVVGPTYLRYSPVVVFDTVNKRVQAHFLQWGDTSGTSNPVCPQGDTVNITSDVIAVTRYVNGELWIGLNSIATMKADGAAYSGGATTPGAAIKTNASVLIKITDYLTKSGNNGIPVFVLPYTTTHFLVVTPRRVWRMRVSDGGIENDFAIDPSNASYGWFLSFGTAPAIPAPVVMADGSIVLYARQARNAADSANVTIAAAVKVDPVTGTTSATNYTGFSGDKAGIIPNPDGTFYLQLNGSPPLTHKVSSDLATVTAITGLDLQQFAFAVSNGQDTWFTSGGPSPYYPVSISVSGSTGTDTLLSSAGAAGPQSTLFTGVANYQMVSVMDATTILVRSATSANTGASLGSYIGVYNKSDGSVATGYTKQQMVDFYGATSLSGSWFENVTFARTNSRSFHDPNLYTVREVLQLMGTTPAAGPVYKVWNGTTYDTGTQKVWNGTTYDAPVVAVEG